MKYQDYQDDEKDETSTCVKDLFLPAGNLGAWSYNYTCEESIAHCDANNVEKDENDYADLIPVKCHSWPLWF